MDYTDEIEIIDEEEEAVSDFTFHFLLFIFSREHPSSILSLK